MWPLITLRRRDPFLRLFHFSASAPLWTTQGSWLWRGREGMGQRARCNTTQRSLDITDVLTGKNLSGPLDLLVSTSLGPQISLVIKWKCLIACCRKTHLATFGVRSQDVSQLPGTHPFDEGFYFQVRLQRPQGGTRSCPRLHRGDHWNPAHLMPNLRPVGECCEVPTGHWALCWELRKVRVLLTKAVELLTKGN